MSTHDFESRIAEALDRELSPAAMRPADPGAARYQAVANGWNWRVPVLGRIVAGLAPAAGFKLATAIAAGAVVVGAGAVTVAEQRHLVNLPGLQAPSPQPAPGGGAGDRAGGRSSGSHHSGKTPDRAADQLIGAQRDQEEVQNAGDRPSGRVRSHRDSTSAADRGPGHVLASPGPEDHSRHRPQPELSPAPEASPN